MDALTLLTFHPSCDESRRNSVMEQAQKWCSDEVVLALQSSGSTGPVKTSMQDRSQIIKSIEATARTFGLMPGMRTALAMDVHGTGGRLMLWRALHLGMHCEILPVQRKVEWAGQLDFLALIPQQAMALDAGAWSRLRCLLLGGAPLAAEQERELLKRSSGHAIRLSHGFGMTETLSHVAIRELGRGASYHCLPGVTVSEDQGALCIHAPERGLHHMRTTDAAKVLNDTEFEWLGRLDGVIISGGKKIFPEAVDRVIADAMPGHPIGFAGSIPDEHWGEALVWYSEELTAVERQDMLQVFETMESWLRPKRIVEGPLPLTASGKWRRKGS